VPAEGQPWFGRGRGRRTVADEGAEARAADSLMVLPAGGTLEYVGADVEPPEGG
jgi:hypothetical protein